MGEKVVAGPFDLSDRHRYRDKLRDCLTGLGRLLEEKRFDRPRNLMGLEIELNLVDGDGQPRMMNAQVLERIASQDFQTELAMFNLEVNIAPHRLGEPGIRPARRGVAHVTRICRPERRGSRRGNRDDRHSADARPGRPGVVEPFRRRPLHAAQRPDRRGAR